MMIRGHTSYERPSCVSLELSLQEFKRLMYRELRVLEYFMLHHLKLSILDSPIQVDVGGIGKSLLGLLVTWRLGVQQARAAKSFKDNQVLTEIIPQNFLSC